MAEGKPGTGAKRPASRRRNEDSGDRQIGVKEIVRQATDYLGEMTGRSAEAVTLVEPSDQGWLVEVEILELARIPASTDVLASYEVELDTDGEPLAYRRVNRHYRASVGEE